MVEYYQFNWHKILFYGGGLLNKLYSDAIWDLNSLLKVQRLFISAITVL